MHLNKEGKEATLRVMIEDREVRDESCRYLGEIVYAKGTANANAWKDELKRVFKGMSRRAVWQEESARLGQKGDGRASL